MFDLIASVMALDVSEGLDAMLSAALSVLDDLNDHNDGAAVKTLEAFISRVEAERGDTITDLEADALIAAAQEIIDLILGA